MNLFKNGVGRPSNELKKKRRIFYVVLTLGIISVLGISGYFVYTKFNSTSNFESTSYNAMAGPVNVIMTPSTGKQSVSKDSLVYFTIKFSVNNKQRYYFKWRTYNNNVNWAESDCTPFYNGASVRKSLTIFGIRQGSISVYSDNKCTKQLGSSVYTKTYTYSSAFTVKYFENNSNNSMLKEVTTVNYGVSTKLLKNKFTRKNYNFYGWKAYNPSTKKWLCYTNDKLNDSDWLPASKCNYGYDLYKNEAKISKTVRPGQTVHMIAEWVPEKRLVVDRVKLSESNELLQDVSIDNNGTIYLSQVSSRKSDESGYYVNLLIHKYSGSNQVSLYDSCYRCGHGFFSINNGWIITTCDFNPNDYEYDGHGVAITRTKPGVSRIEEFKAFPGHRGLIKVDSKSKKAIARSKYEGVQHFKVFEFNPSRNSVDSSVLYSFDLPDTKYDIQGYDIDSNKLYIYYGEGSTCGEHEPSKSVAYIDVYDISSYKIAHGGVSLIKHNFIYMQDSYAEPEGLDVYGDKVYIGIAQSNGNACHKGPFVASVYSINKSLLSN